MKKFKRYDFNKGKPKSTRVEKIAFIAIIFVTIFCLFWSLRILNGHGMFSTEFVPHFIFNEAQRYTGVSPVFREKIIPVMVLIIYCKCIIFFITLISRNWKGYVEWARYHEMVRLLISILIMGGVFYVMPHMFGLFHVSSVEDLPHGMAGFGMSLFNGKLGLFFLFFFAAIVSYGAAATLVLFFAKLRSYF